MDDTTAPSSPGAESTSTFNANETKLICAIMQNLTSEIQFDAEKVALSLGYKNSGSLRARWNSLKRSKISGGGGDAAAAPTGGVSKSTPSKKAKATPKKVKAAADGGESPSLGDGGKKAGKGSKGSTKVKTEEGGDEDVVESVEGSKGVAIGENFFSGD